MKKFLLALLIAFPCFAKAQVSSFVSAPGGNVGIATTTPAALFTVGNGTLAVTSAGNVGIGVAVPSYALQNAGAAFMQGQEIIGSTLTVQGAAFSIGGSSFVVRSGSASLAYQFEPGSISLTGSTGTIVNQSSITASAFFGDGSHLTGAHYHVNISSTIFPTSQTAFTNTSNIGAMAGSTITITIAAGSIVKITYSCAMAGGSGNSLFVNVGVNNGISGFPMGQALYGSSAFLYSAGPYYTFQAIASNTGFDGPYASAVTLSYSLYTVTDEDTGYLDIGSGSLCVFAAEELPQ